VKDSSEGSNRFSNQNSSGDNSMKNGGCGEFGKRVGDQNRMGQKKINKRNM